MESTEIDVAPAFENAVARDEALAKIPDDSVLAVASPVDPDGTETRTLTAITEVNDEVVETAPAVNVTFAL